MTPKSKTQEQIGREILRELQYASGQMQFVLAVYDENRRNAKIDKHKSFPFAIARKGIFAEVCLFICDKSKDVKKYRSIDDIKFSTCLIYKDDGKMYAYLCAAAYQPFYIDEAVLRRYDAWYELQLSTTQAMLIHLFKHNEFSVTVSKKENGEIITLLSGSAGTLLGRSNSESEIISCTESVFAEISERSTEERRDAMTDQLQSII